MRQRRMRRLHGQCRRQCGALMPGRDRPPRRQLRDDDRSAVARSFAPGAAGLGCAIGPAMRLLPVGDDHGRGRLARSDPGTDRRGYRRRDHQYLPLRHLSPSPRGDPPGGSGQVRRGTSLGSAAAGNRSGRCRALDPRAENPASQGFEPLIPFGTLHEEFSNGSSARVHKPSHDGRRRAPRTRGETDA